MEGGAGGARKEGKAEIPRKVYVREHSRPASLDADQEQHTSKHGLSSKEQLTAVRAPHRPREGVFVQRHIHFSVPLYLDPLGRSRMTHAWTTVRRVRGALTGHIQNRALSVPGSFRAAADGSIRAARPGQSVAVPLISAEQLLTELRQVASELGWSAVLPVNTLELLVQGVLKELRTLPQHRPVPFGALPGAWPSAAPAIIPVRGGIHPLNRLQVAIGLLGKHAVQFCDFFALPERFETAVVQAAEQHYLAEQTRVAHAEDRLRRGETAALADIMRIAGRMQPADLASRTSERQLPGDLPILTDRFRLHQVPDLNGQLNWHLSLRLRVNPRQFKLAWIDDTCGVDVGADELITFASLFRSGRVVVPAVQGTLPVIPVPHSSEAPRVYNRGMALATGRLALMMCVRAEYERVLEAILEHQHVAVEKTNWSGFERYPSGFFFPSFAQAVHLPAFLHWLTQLAPLHGSQVSPVDPTDSSSICSVCNRPGKRPKRGEPFRCQYPDCGAVTPGHLNACHTHRRRGLPKRRR